MDYKNIIKQHINILNTQATEIETKTSDFAKILINLLNKKKKTFDSGQWRKCSRCSTYID